MEFLKETRDTGVATEVQGPVIGLKRGRETRSAAAALQEGSVEDGDGSDLMELTSYKRQDIATMREGTVALVDRTHALEKYLPLFSQQQDVDEHQFTVERQQLELSKSKLEIGKREHDEKVRQKKEELELAKMELELENKKHVFAMQKMKDEVSLKNHLESESSTASADSAAETLRQRH
jgi:hypothetical protein